MSEETSFEEYLENTTVSESDSFELEGEESSLEKESADVFRNESDTETSTETFSEDNETDSNTSSFMKESSKDEFEVEDEETDDESTFFNDTKLISPSAKPKQLIEEGLTANMIISSLEKESIGDSFVGDRDGIVNKSFDNVRHNLSASTMSPKLEITSVNAEKTSYLLRDESDMEKSTDTYSKESGVHDSTFRIVKEFTNYNFEDENEEVGAESITFNRAKRTTIAKPKQMEEECLTDYMSISNTDGSTGDGNESFNNVGHTFLVSSNSLKLTTEAVNAENSTSNLTFMVEESIQQTDVSASVKQNGTRSTFRSESNEKQNADSEKLSLSPTEAMKALRISDSPTQSEPTPRQSRFRAKTFNIFDSPYNTRLKARMMREKEMRSRSEEKPTDE